MSVSTRALTIAIIVGFLYGCSASTGSNGPSIEAGALQTTEHNASEQASAETEPTETAISLEEEGHASNSPQLIEETITASGDSTSESPAEVSAAAVPAEIPPAAMPTVAESETAQITEPASIGERTATEVAQLGDESGRSMPESSVPALTVEEISFSKTARNAGEVKISLSSEAAFTLENTAPNEFVVRIPGSTLGAGARSAMVAPPGFPGIRSVRASSERGSSELRMFVDPGIKLTANAAGRSVSISTAENTTDAPVLSANETQKAARGQLKKDSKGEPAEAAASGEDIAKFNPTGLRSADGSKVYTGRLISLDLQEADIDNALRIIAEVSQLNIITSEDVKGKVTLRLVEVPWDQALDVILKSNGLDQVQEGNVIRIAPVDKLRAEREALLEAKQAAEALEDLQVRYIRVSYARAADVQEQVQSVLTERGSVAIDERTNQLIVKDIDKGQEQAAELLRRLDLRTPQILLETQIVEASKSLTRNLGFQWNYDGAMATQYGNATGLNFPNQVFTSGSVGGDTPWASSFPAAGVADGLGSAITTVLESADGARTFTARLSAFEQEGLVKVISRPQIATVNNKEAKIEATEVMHVRLPDSGTSIATGQGAAASSSGDNATEEIKVGIELTVTPQASPDYFVLMDLDAKSSTFSSESVEGIKNTIERKATSTVLVKSGQTFALGGVYRIQDGDDVQGIPFLKDIPFLGHAFRSSMIEKADEELIFFITPHIVEGSFDKAQL